MNDSATLDQNLYSFATMRMEQRAANKIAQSIDTDSLSRWFAGNLREAYSAGLKDGYVQGRHDQHGHRTVAYKVEINGEQYYLEPQAVEIVMEQDHPGNGVS